MALGHAVYESGTTPVDGKLVKQIIVLADGKPGAVFIRPAIAIDGLTGRPRWKGQAGLGDDPFGPFVPQVLDAGGSSRMPLLIGNGLGATVCRVEKRMDAEGGSVAGTGQRVSWCS